MGGYPLVLPASPGARQSPSMHHFESCCFSGMSLVLVLPLKVTVTGTFAVLPVTVASPETAACRSLACCHCLASESTSDCFGLVHTRDAYALASRLLSESTAACA